MQEFTNQPLLKKKKNCSKFPLADKQKQVFFYEFSSGHEGGGRGEEEEEEKKKNNQKPPHYNVAKARIQQYFDFTLKHLYK